MFASVSLGYASPPYSQTLEEAGKACQRQTLTHSRHLYFTILKRFITLGPDPGPLQPSAAVQHGGRITVQREGDGAKVEAEYSTQQTSDVKSSDAAPAVPFAGAHAAPSAQRCSAVASADRRQNTTVASAAEERPRPRRGFETAAAASSGSDAAYPHSSAGRRLSSRRASWGLYVRNQLSSADGTTSVSAARFPSSVCAASRPAFFPRRASASRRSFSPAPSSFSRKRQILVSML